MSHAVAIIGLPGLPVERVSLINTCASNRISTNINCSAIVARLVSKSFRLASNSKPYIFASLGGIHFLYAQPHRPISVKCVNLKLRQKDERSVVLLKLAGTTD
jgi:hypothetical protein